MSETTTVVGKCLCGAITITAKNVKKELGACHCEMCRKWTGGPLMSIAGGIDVSIEGKEHVTVFDSSPWAERGFCNKCGSGLFYRVKENQFYSLTAGLFEDSGDWNFTMQVFIDKKCGGYSFAEETATMTEKQMFDMYAPQDNIQR